MEDTDLFSGAENPNIEAAVAGVPVGAKENAGTTGLAATVVTGGFAVAGAGEDTVEGFAAAGTPKLPAVATELGKLKMLEDTDDAGF